MGVRETRDGSVAVFVRSSDEQSFQTNFYMWNQQGELLSMRLPHDGKRWRGVKVVPNMVSDPFLLFVAPQEETESIMEGMFRLSSSQNQDHSLVQLWEFDALSAWQEISTRGDIPDRMALTAPGAGCRMLNGKVVLFGGISPFPQPANGRDLSMVFLFCPFSRTWLRVPHPYQLSYSVGQQGPSVQSLPPYAGMSTCRLDGSVSEIVLLLRGGNSLVNEKRGNELVPKFVLDVFGDGGTELPSSSTRHLCWWKLDVPTYDKSGYVADLMGTRAIQVGNSLLVLGLGGSQQFVQRLQSPDSTRQFDDSFGTMGRVSTDLLDLETMEWRSLVIHNAWLLGTCSTSGELVCSRSNDLYRLVIIDGGKLRFLALRNFADIKSCVKEAISTKKLKSKKNTLSYLLKKAKKTAVQPFCTCAFCGMFEAPGVVPFKCCARCRVPFYCSRECQSRHWKREHKAVCKAP
jgi:hypothetical protein